MQQILLLLWGTTFRLIFIEEDSFRNLKWATEVVVSTLRLDFFCPEHLHPGLRAPDLQESRAMLFHFPFWRTETSECYGKPRFFTFLVTIHWYHFLPIGIISMFYNYTVLFYLYGDSYDLLRIYHVVGTFHMIMYVCMNKRPHV